MLYSQWNDMSDIYRCKSRWKKNNIYLFLLNFSLLIFSVLKYSSWTCSLVIYCNSIAHKNVWNGLDPHTKYFHVAILEAHISITNQPKTDNRLFRFSCTVTQAWNKHGRSIGLKLIEKIKHNLEVEACIDYSGGHHWIP